MKIGRFNRREIIFWKIINWAKNLLICKESSCHHSCCTGLSTASSGELYFSYYRNIWNNVAPASFILKTWSSASLSSMALYLVKPSLSQVKSVHFSDHKDWIVCKGISSIRCFGHTSEPFITWVWLVQRTLPLFFPPEYSKKQESLLSFFATFLIYSDDGLQL